MSVAVDAVLAVLVGSGWLAAIGFLRLKAPLDRLHCVSFAGASLMPLLVVASLLADGASGRVVKILILAAGTLFNGAALAHASGRALRLRAAAR